MINNNSKKALNKFIVGSALFSTSALCLLTGISILPKTACALGQISNVSISNGSFTSTYNSNDLTVPNNWTKINSNSSSVIACVVSTDSEKFEDNNKNKYGDLPANPGKASSASATDNNVFMISSQNQSVQYGYESNAFALSSNGNYVIQVPVKTQGGAVASLYLVDEANNFNLKLENITSNTNYNTYAFMVKTDSFTNLSVKLQLWLGTKGGTSSTGSVFFDEISAVSYTESTFDSVLGSSSAYADTAVSLDFSTTTLSPVIGDNSFTVLSETGSNSSDIGNFQGIVSTVNNALYPEDVQVPSNGNLINNETAYLIKNNKSASIGIRTNALSIPQYGYFLVTTYVKTSTTTGGLNVKLVQQDETVSTTYNTVGNQISNYTSSGSDDKLNGWDRLTFAVRGSSYKRTDLQMEFWLGSSDTSSSGYAFIGKTTIEPLSDANYDSISETNNKKLVNLASFTEDSTSFSNHSFNQVTTEANELGDYSQNFTFAKPANFTNLSNINTVYGTYDSTLNCQSGIINTNETVFNSFGYYFANPGLTQKQAHSNLNTQTNNVLAISQKQHTMQGYQSETKSLSANSKYKISVYVKTSVASSLLNGIDNQTGGANFYLKTSDGKVLASFTNIVANSEWSELSCFVKTGLDAVTVQSELWLGNSEVKTSGVAFFDDLMIATVEDTAFASATNSVYSRVLNLATDNFEAISQEKLNGVYSSLNWSSTNTNSENSVSGILNTSTLLSTDPTWGNVPNPQTPNNTISNVLAIHNLQDSATTYTNDLTQTLLANSYYKISVWAKTHLISQSETNSQKDDNDETIPYGAFISIDKVEDSFQAIQSSDWKQYTFYVHSDTEISLKLNLSLGSDNAKTSGYAYFSCVEVSSIEEEAFTLGVEGIENSTEKTSIKVATAIKDTSDDSTTDDNSANKNSGNASDSNLWLIIPSLITALALIIAIIGTILRQIKFNRFVSLKKKSNSYDRKKTLAKNARRAEVDKVIKSKVAELQSELNEFEEKLAKESADLTLAKEKYEELKAIKHANFETRKQRILAKNEFIKANSNYHNTLADANLIKDDIAKIKSEKYILKEEYQIIMREWSEQRKQAKDQKQKRKNVEKMKKNALKDSGK